MSNKVTWILSPDVFGENIINLKNEIIKQGHGYLDIAKYFQFRTEILPDIQTPCIFYGSIESATHISRTTKLYPGVYCDLNKFKCSYYYPRVRNLLNGHHTFLPFGELKEQKEWLFDEFGMDRTVFLRPDGGGKLFTGQLVQKETFEKALDDIRAAPEDMVIVAEPKDIDEEYRLVFCQGNYVTGSMYKFRGKLDKCGELSIPNFVIEAAVKAVRHYNPEPTFIVDMGLAWDGPKVIEVNSFSCSGLYLCNLEKIVSEVSRTVYEDWRDMYDNQHGLY